MSVRTPSATVTFDHLYRAGDTVPDEVGASWEIGPAAPCADPIIARAYDDDGERYYTLSVILPTDPDDEDDALSVLLSTLGRHAGVTSVQFPGRRHLDVG